MQARVWRKSSGIILIQIKVISGSLHNIIYALSFCTLVSKGRIVTLNDIEDFLPTLSICQFPKQVDIKLKESFGHWKKIYFRNKL